MNGATADNLQESINRGLKYQGFSHPAEFDRVFRQL